MPCTTLCLNRAKAGGMCVNRRGHKMGSLYQLSAHLLALRTYASVSSMVAIHSIVVALLPLIPTTLGQTCATIKPVNAANFSSGYQGRVVVNGLEGKRESGMRHH
jgi:hypothetical protein